MWSASLIYFYFNPFFLQVKIEDILFFQILVFIQTVLYKEITQNIKMKEINPKQSFRIYYLYLAAVQVHQGSRFKMGNTKFELKVENSFQKLKARKQQEAP